MRTSVTDEQLARVLKRTRVVVGVSEPFGFGYPAGSDGLYARVVGVDLGGGPGGGEAIVLELEAPFVSEEGPLITRLRATARYSEDAGRLVRSLATGEHVSANLSYEEQVPEEARTPNASPKLVGGIDLAD